MDAKLELKIAEALVTWYAATNDDPEIEMSMGRGTAPPGHLLFFRGHKDIPLRPNADLHGDEFRLVRAA